MPYTYRSIGQQNVNTLRGMAHDKEASELNALKIRQAKQTINAADRQSLMQMHWIAGKGLESVKDEESFQRFKTFAKNQYGDKASKEMQDWPSSYDEAAGIIRTTAGTVDADPTLGTTGYPGRELKSDPDPDSWLNRMQAENNIYYEALGMGKKLPVTFRYTDVNGNTKEVKTIAYSPQHRRLQKKHPNGSLGELVKPSKWSPTTKAEELDLYRSKKEIDKESGGGVAGTEVERQAALLGMSVPDYRLMMKKKLQIGMSDEDKRRYDKWDERAYTTRREIQKLEADLSRFPAPKEGEDDFNKGRRQLLQTYKEDLRRYQNKMDAIVKPQGGEIKIPQATIDYWRSKGKTLEEIQKAFEKKYGKNPPKIGF